MISLWAADMMGGRENGKSYIGTAPSILSISAMPVWAYAKVATKKREQRAKPAISGATDNHHINELFVAPGMGAYA